MPMNWLPHPDDWQKSLAVHKLKADNGLSKALAELWKFRTDEYDKRLAQLPKILKLATEFRKSKEVVAAGTPAVKMVTEVIDTVPKVRKQLEQDKREFESNGAHPVDVQIIVVDWNGKPVEYAKAYARFQSPGVPSITEGCKLSANGFDINDIRLRPSGTLNLTVYPNGGSDIEGVTDYEFKPGRSVIKFKAVQHSQKFKTRAKSLDEVTHKLGVKGSAGVDYKVLKVGGEVSTEDQFKVAYEDEILWELEAGLPTFKDFKQI